MQNSTFQVAPSALHEDNNNGQLTAVASTTPIPSPAKAVNDYAELKKRIKQQKLLDKQPVYYTFKIIATLGLLALSVTLLFTVHNFWFQLFNAALLAVASAQLGFLGHDGGHRQIFHTTRKNEMLTLITGNLLIGMSNGWW
ncbi:MAG TPA: hypothetical protein VHD63_14960, partial [Ktedonobacteraceae bacterium]|nr:hypothetical protein [Ktedonobacteraceae bacterium]